MQEAKRACRMLHKEHLGNRYVELYMSRTAPPSPHEVFSGAMKEYNEGHEGAIGLPEPDWTEVCVLFFKLGLQLLQKNLARSSIAVFFLVQFRTFRRELKA